MAISTLEDYGAVGDGVTDDTTSIQNALNAQRELRIIADRQYRITSPLTLSKVPKIVGSGHTSEIYADFSTTQAGALIISNPGSDTMTFKTGGLLESFKIDSPCPSIVFDLTGGTASVDYFNGWNCFNLNAHNRNTSGNTAAIQLKNPTLNDGFFSSRFEKCVVHGGFNMERLGDSVTFYNNTIWGLGTGIYFDAVQGAARVSILDNNISSEGTGIYAANYAQDLTISRNTIENIAGNPPQLLVLWAASGKNLVNPKIIDNTFNANNQLQSGGSIIAVGLVTDGVIDENRFNNVNQVSRYGIWFSGSPNSPSGIRYGKRNTYSNVTTNYLNSAGSGVIIE